MSPTSSASTTDQDSELPASDAVDALANGSVISKDGTKSAVPETPDDSVEDKQSAGGKQAAEAAVAPASTDAGAPTDNPNHVSSPTTSKNNASPPSSSPAAAPKSSPLRSSPPSAKTATKVKVHFVAAGSAPILKKSKFLMSADDRFAVAATFLRKRIGLEGKGSSVLLYVNAAFVPSPEERVGDLYACFSSERGELVVHYSLQEAWG